MWTEMGAVMAEVLNEEHDNLCISSNIIRVFKLRRMRLVGNVARMMAKRTAFRILVGKARRIEISVKP
jgi:hypothetical protein